MNHPALTVLESMAVPALTNWVENALATEQVRWVAGSFAAIPEFALVDLDNIVLLTVWVEEEDFEIFSEDLEELTR